MTHGRIERYLISHGDVRGGEARAALNLAAYFFFITFTFYIVKPVKESALISFLSPSWWPYADLVTALLIGFVVALNVRLLDRVPRRTYLTASLLFFMAGTLVFGYVFDVHRAGAVMTPVIDPSGIAFIIWVQAVVPAIWVYAVIAFAFWTDVFVATSVTQFWIAVNDVFDAHQAKRLVGLFVTGGLLGGIAGSAAAALVTFARVLRIEDLLLAAPVPLALAAVTVNLVYAGRQRVDAAVGDGRIGAPARAGVLESFRAVRRSRYLLLLAGMLASAIVAGALINYQFKQVLKSAFESAAERTAFIAVLFLAILAVSTALHLAATGRFLKAYGIRWAIVIAPAVLLAGSLAVFALPAGLLLGWAALVRGGDKLFDNTLCQSVRELLYIPVPADVKYKGKIFIDMFVAKFATGLGAVLFGALYALRQFAYRNDGSMAGTLAVVRETGVLTLAFLALWLVMTRLVYREYPAVLKKDIRRKWASGDEAVARHVDLDLTLQIFNTIQSRERSSTLYYMNLFNLVRRGGLTPDLKELLGIRRDEAKARALDALFDVGGGSFHPGLEEALADEEFRSEVDLVFLLPAYQKVMGERLEGIAGSASEVDRAEAANSLSRMAPTEAALRALGRLLEDPSAEVVLYALMSAAVHRFPGHVPAVVRQLARPATRPEAQSTLAAYGPGVVDALASALRDEAEPLEVRRAIPEVLARIGTQDAADVLVEALARRSEDLEGALVDALFKVRTDRPGVRFRDAEVRPALLGLVRKACDLVLDPPGPEAETRALLDIRVRRAFELLTLLYPREDVVNAYQNIRQGTARTADYSLESLDILLDRELKELLLPLVEDLPAEERRRRLRRALRLK
ncbi:MAG TPA: Npt1/Npt2 family nucleotide transporter [Candidatus Aminicenantes bacterium]|nr:Npt1/Npt2 family nucleotide transporter [Candidatus Aminicenantes bacterium]